MSASASVYDLVADAISPSLNSCAPSQHVFIQDAPDLSPSFKSSISPTHDITPTLAPNGSCRGTAESFESSALGDALVGCCSQRGQQTYLREDLLAGLRTWNSL